MKKKENSMFDCPSCGNPLIKSKKEKIRCIYCKRLVDVPHNTDKKKVGGK